MASEKVVFTLSYKQYTIYRHCTSYAIGNAQKQRTSLVLSEHWPPLQNTFPPQLIVFRWPQNFLLYTIITTKVCHCKKFKWNVHFNIPRHCVQSGYMQRQNTETTTFTEAVTIPLTRKGCQSYTQQEQKKIREKKRWRWSSRDETTSDTLRWEGNMKMRLNKNNRVLVWRQ